MADPTFASPSTNPFGITNVTGEAAPTLVDIDNDGDLDAFVGEKGAADAALHFFENTGTTNAPTFAAAVTNPFGLSVGLKSNPTFADIDNDDDFDAFVGNENGQIVFFENIGTADAPTFAASQTNPFGLPVTVGGTNATPTLVDIDNDGDLDVFAGNGGGNTVFFENTGTAGAPTFAASQIAPFGITDVGLNAAPTLVDIDGDGDFDAFVGNSDGDIFFFENTGTVSTPTFAAPVTNPFELTNVGPATPPPFGDPGPSASPAFADIDGNGGLDAFIGNSDGNILYFANQECFLTGTLITTDQGEVPVETLKIGDRVKTADGDYQPVKWVGHQTFDRAHHQAHPFRTYPICIKAGALGHHLPRRDLYISPDHAILVGNLLINAGALTNDQSIVQVTMEKFVYHHIELEQHSLLLAEGTPAESYLPQNQARDIFDNGDEYEALYPNENNAWILPMSFARVSSKRQLPRSVAKPLKQIAETLVTTDIPVLVSM